MMRRFIDGAEHIYLACGATDFRKQIPGSARWCGADSICLCPRQKSIFVIGKVPAVSLWHMPGHHNGIPLGFFQANMGSHAPTVEVYFNSIPCNADVHALTNQIKWDGITV